jgi:hypothetical protein
MTQVLILNHLTEDDVRYRAGVVVDFASSALITLRKAGGFVDDNAGAIAAAIAAGASQFVHASQIEAVKTARVGRSGQLEVASVGSAYTLGLADVGKHVRVDSAGAAVVNVPTHDAAPIPLYATITVEQAGAGAVTLTPAAGVTLNRMSTLSAAIANRYGVAQLIKTGANTWTLFGALAAA